MLIPRLGPSVERKFLDLPRNDCAGVLPSSQNNYCCKMGDDGNPERERQQFRAYSWQAPLFCMRMARGKRYPRGSVSRGGC